MKITGVKSICCGKGVKSAPISKREGDKIFTCLGCGKICEHYYTAEAIKGRKNLKEVK